MPAALAGCRSTRRILLVDFLDAFATKSGILLQHYTMRTARLHSVHMGTCPLSHAGFLTGPTAVSLPNARRLSPYPSTDGHLLMWLRCLKADQLGLEVGLVYWLIDAAKAIFLD